MATVSIVGGRAGGKTTALGLLHDGLTAYALRNKEFRFEPDLMSTTYLDKDVLKPINTGKFPTPTTPGSRLEVKLFLKFKRGLLPRWIEMVINAYDISGEDIEVTLERMTTAKTIQEIIGDLRERKTLAALLESEVFVFIVDGLSCDPSDSEESTEKKAENDLFLRKLWLAIKEYKKRTKWNLKGLGIIFAKYDEAHLFLPLGEVEYHSLKDDLDQPMLLDKVSQTVTSTFEDVVRKYLPYTWDTMKYDIEKIKRENLEYFRSGLIMKQDDEMGKARIGIPLTFSIHEYVRLAKWLSSI